MRLVICILLCLTMGCCAVPTCSAEQQPPSVSAAAAVVMDVTSGTLLYEKNPHEQRSMASTTKIMTTLLALEAGNLDRTIVTTKEMVTVEGSGMGLKAGDSITMEGLCYGMMLSSGNDAANTVALVMDGSLNAFANRMNQKAEKIGMKNTHFVTPSGLDADTHYSTAYDMALLTRHALGNGLFRQMASASSAAVHYGNPPYRRILTNHNRLLKEFDGCIGVKTGFTKKSGRCLVTAATRNGATLICVTLKAPDDWDDHKKLLNYGFDQMEQLTVEGKTFALPLTGGVREKVAVSYPDLQVCLPKQLIKAAITTRQAPHFCYAPITQGDVVGTVAVVINGNPVASVPITATETVARYIPPDGFLVRFKRALRNLLYL